MFEEIDKSKYVSLTTFRGNGDAVSTPIWLAGSGGTYEMITSGSTGKAKRLRNNSRVTVASCNATGKVAAGAKAFDGTLQLLEGAGGDRAAAAVASRYGITSKVMSVSTGSRRSTTRTTNSASGSPSTD